MHLGRSQRLSGLERLELSGNFIKVEGLRYLMRSEWLGGVSELDISENHLIPRAGRMIAASTTMRLRSLAIASNELRPTGLQALARAEALEAVERLDISDNRLNGASLHVLGDSPVFAKLEQLDLSHNTLGNAAWTGLLQRWEMPAVRKLSLNMCGLGDSALDALLDHPVCARLELLELSGNDISLEAIERLASQGDRLASLRELAMGGTPAEAASAELSDWCLARGVRYNPDLLFPQRRRWSSR